MLALFDHWGFIAGIALFLFAMTQLETGLKALGGRSLAAQLRVGGSSRINAVLGGVVGTALLQSSSIVGLMVLAFTGAGLLSLASALGIIFGSNLGTTLTGWIIALLGFKFEIDELSLPMIACGGLAFVFGRGKLPELGRAILGLGLLLMGLELMKSSVMSFEELIDINDLENLSPWQYLLVGTIVAAVIQSSSATMVITLAALHAQIITLPNAAAIAIGADLGTTTTVMIGALNGSFVKKQVAAGHVIFNVVTDMIAFLLRTPLLLLIGGLGISDPLYSLVAFHSLFNLLGLCLFVPFTDTFARRLERLFPAAQKQEAQYLCEVSSGIGEAAVAATEREASVLIARTMTLISRVFDPPLKTPPGHHPMPHLRGIEASFDQSFEELYRAAKRLEGELVEFVIRLQTESLSAADSQRLGQLLNAAREAMHSAKAIKDIRHNLLEVDEPSVALPDEFGGCFRSNCQTFLRGLYALRPNAQHAVEFAELAELLSLVKQQHDSLSSSIYAGVRDDKVDETQVSSLLNVNRELFTSARCLIFALGSYFLPADHAAELERLRV